jgi:RND family efflux transporter MFP subunit
MRKKTIYPIMLMLLLVSCKQKNDTNTAIQQSTIAIKTEEVNKIMANDLISMSGNIEGKTTVRLGFMVAGKVNYISSKEGQNITKGQLIASLDPANYIIAKEISDAQVNATADEFKRLKTMHDRASVSDGDFSKISFGLDGAKAQQKLQAKNLSDTKLFSPISGVLLKKQTEVGEIIGVGIPLFVISDISTVKVIAYIPEGELHHIKLGQTASVFISSLDETYSGKVIEVGSAADVTSRAFTVKIEIQNPKQLIRPGMIAEVKLSSSQEKETITLPAEAILHDLDNQSYVFVVDKKQNKAFKRKISIGNVIDNKITITSGLTIGETVVTAGQTKLNDGSLITINK